MHAQLRIVGLAWDKLPETEKFQRLAPSRKQLVDTVKMIAYRARMPWLRVRESLARTDDARSLLVDLFRSRPTCCLMWSGGYCVCKFIRCRTRGPTAQSPTC